MDKEKKPRLKRCPFCGGKARLYKTTAGTGMTHYFVYGVGCWVCGAKVESVLGETVAIRKWSRRVKPRGKNEKAKS